MATSPAASSTLHDDDMHQNLLLRTSETVLQMAEVARRNNDGEDGRTFFTYLGYHCLRLRHHLRRAQETASRLGPSLVNQALRQLSSILFENRTQELTNPPSMIGTASDLNALNRHWALVLDQPDKAKLEFMNQWLRLEASEQKRAELDTALEICVDQLEKQQPVKPFEEPTDTSRETAISESPYSIGKPAQLIFDALVHCEGCSCPSKHHFGAKLELGTYRKTHKEKEEESSALVLRKRLRKLHSNNAAGELDFEMFLSMDQAWHEVRIHTLKDRLVSLNISGQEASIHDKAAPGRHEKVDKLCRAITRTKALQRLVLKLTAGQLFEMAFEKGNFRISKTAEPISLSQCFEERHEFFTEKTKRILSLIIGYTVFHLNGTSWLPPGWGSANIKFFHTTSSKTPLRPFIYTQLPGASPTEGAATDEFQVIVDGGDDGDGDGLDDDSMHRCPVLISLAVVLMEIYFVKTFRQLAEMHDIPLVSESGDRISLIDVDQVFYGEEESGLEGWKSHIPEYSPLLKAIENCLNPELWEDSDGQALDGVTLRSQIYDHIVRHLELQLNHGFSNIPLDGIDQYARSLDLGNWGQAITSQEPDWLAVQPPLRAPTPSRSLSSALSQPEARLSRPDSVNHRYQSYPHASDPIPMAGQEHAPKSPINYKAAQFFDDEPSRRETNLYLRWKLEYGKVYEKFVGEHLSGPPSSPVKIAILDTGIDADHYVFEAREENIKEKRNFHQKSLKSVQDRNGHGTFIASLVLDYAPDAAIYIIKVVDKENTRPDAKIVADAINHAVDEWDVDIISMSFGWPSSEFDDHATLQAAIDKAYFKKILIFAAASNSGARLARAYPASSSQVICVHSTNTYGSRSDFSPTAQLNTINIATVGESVQSAWPTLLCDEQNASECVKSRSGTSYATPILAGISAFLLQYARLNLPETDAQELKRKEKMEALLKRCAQRGPNHDPRDGYFYVELSLHKHNLFGEEMKNVNYEMSKALKT